MEHNIIGATVTLVLGAGISLINYLISRHIILNYPEKYALAAIFRQIIQIGFLVAVFLVGNKTEADIIYLLIGAVLGITFTMFYFTHKLLKLNEKKSNENSRTEGDTDG